MIKALSTTTLLLAALSLSAGLLPNPPATAQDADRKFRDLGVVAPVSSARGTVATVDGAGRNIVLSWLMDHRGGYELLLIDAETGKTEEYPVPFSGSEAPFAALVSKRNRYYTHYNNHFVEFDPVQRKYTFHRKTAPMMAMSMTEDDQGVIWSATYPQSGVVSYNPETGEFRDYGHVYTQNWRQYPRSIAVDSAGWVYLGIGTTRGQIVALDPKSGKATPIVPEAERVPGTAYVYRDQDGTVYGRSAGTQDGVWYALREGKARRLDSHAERKPVPVIAGSQTLFHRSFPDGKRVKTLDLTERELVVEDPKNGTTRTLRFNYHGEGAYVMGVAVAPDGTVTGGTFFPFRSFSFDPKENTLTHRPSVRQWNTIARQGDRFFAGVYPGGMLLEWNPAAPWDSQSAEANATNPKRLAENSPAIHRPHDLLAYPDGKTLILAGTPDYGRTGGAVFFWDRKTAQGTVLSHQDFLPEHSTMSLVPVAGGKVLGGTTTSAGTGGEKKAKEAALYILDLASKKVEWYEAVFPGVQEYTDLAPGPNGLIYGIADSNRFFVFDPKERRVIHQRSTMPEFGRTPYAQGPRVLVPDGKGNVYLLFTRSIARIDPATFELTRLAETPVTINAGGDILDGRLYFTSGSHLYSYELPVASESK